MIRLKVRNNKKELIYSEYHATMPLIRKRKKILKVIHKNIKFNHKEID